EFALVKTQGKAISFLKAFQQYMNAKELDTSFETPKITVTTSGAIYGPDSLELDTGVIFNHHYQSGITLSPGEEVVISFNTFRMVEGLTFISQTNNPIQEIIIESSRDGSIYYEDDRAVINKTNLSVYELNQFRAGVKSNNYITHIKFKANEN